MSICSIHGRPQPDCPQCKITADILSRDPVFAKKIQEAKVAGEYTCVCGFIYYKTAHSCPLCSTPR